MFTLDPWVDGGIGTGPMIIVKLNNVTAYCGEEITITVGKIRTFEEFLCEGDERPLEEQRADPIVGEGFEVRLPKGHIEEGESIDMCLEVADYHKCSSISYTTEDTPSEISFNVP